VEDAELFPQSSCLSIEHRMPHIKCLFLGGKSTPEARVAHYTGGVAEIVLAVVTSR
jgi:hypothetical protein